MYILDGIPHAPAEAAHVEDQPLLDFQSPTSRYWHCLNFDLADAVTHRQLTLVNEAQSKLCASHSIRSKSDLRSGLARLSAIRLISRMPARTGMVDGASR